MLNELNTHFTTNELWVVDFEPIVNFDPAQEKQTPFTDANYEGQDYGKSSLGKLDVQPKLTSRGRPNRDYVQPVINAIRITGYRKNDRNKVVIDRFHNLLEKSPYFTMTKTDLKPQKGKKKKNAKEQLYTLDEVIKENKTDKDEGKIAAPFTIILPLTNPIPVE